MFMKELLWQMGWKDLGLVTIWKPSRSSQSPSFFELKRRLRTCRIHYSSQDTGDIIELIMRGVHLHWDDHCIPWLWANHTVRSAALASQLLQLGSQSSCYSCMAERWLPHGYIITLRRTFWSEWELTTEMISSWSVLTHFAERLYIDTLWEPFGVRTDCDTRHVSRSVLAFIALLIGEVQLLQYSHRA